MLKLPRRASASPIHPTTLERLELRTFLSASAPMGVNLERISQLPEGIRLIQAGADGERGVVGEAPIARISAQPTSGDVPLAVQFDGSASSDPNGQALRFRWRFGDGSPQETGAVVDHTYQRSGAFLATLTVRDTDGNRDRQQVRILAGIDAPTAQITLPTSDTLYQAGDSIRLVGSGIDSSGIPIDNSDLRWRANLIINGRIRRLPTVLSGNQRTVELPNRMSGTPDQALVISLVARDRETGLSTTTRVTLQPRQADLLLSSTTAGLRLAVDGNRIVTPQNVSSTVDGIRRVVAPRTQVLDGTTYQFIRWSDGGARAHTVRVGVGGLTLVAVYQITSVPTQTTPGLQLGLVGNPGLFSNMTVDAGGGLNLILGGDQGLVLGSFGNGSIFV